MKVGDRISVDGSLGTVNYVGNVHVWGPNTLAYGIEWDDASRGKNNGDLDGIKYFHTSVAGSGLFIKASNKKIEQGMSVMDAIIGRYASEENERVLEEKITFGFKTVESYGFQKLNRILKNVKELETVMLDKQKVQFAGKLSSFPMAESLDLSFNLLSSWEELGKILTHFPNLKSLNLNGNRFFGRPHLSLPSLLKEVFLASSMVSAEQLNHLNLSNIEKLILAGINWTSFEVEQLNVLLSWILLDLSFNHLHVIPPSLKLSGVQKLILSDNQIQDLDDGSTFASIVSLDLRYNNITQWETIDKLSVVFPNLSDLRIDGCPIFTNLTTERMTVELIARLGCNGDPYLKSKLRRLNGSMLSLDEIRNAELYFISKVNLGAIKFENQGRWSQLVQKYKILTVFLPSTPPDSNKLTLLIRFEDRPNDEVFSRLFLKTNTILRLKGIVSKQIGKRVLDFELYYYINGEEVDAVKQYLQNNVARLQSFVLSENQKVYVSLGAAN